MRSIGVLTLTQICSRTFAELPNESAFSIFRLNRVEQVGVGLAKRFMQGPLNKPFMVRRVNFRRVVNIRELCSRRSKKFDIQGVIRIRNRAEHDLRVINNNEFRALYPAPPPRPRRVQLVAR